MDKGGPPLLFTGVSSAFTGVEGGRARKTILSLSLNFQPGGGGGGLRQQAGGTHVGFFFFSFFSVIFAASAFVSPFFFLHPWFFLAEMCRDSFLPCSLLDAWERVNLLSPRFSQRSVSPPIHESLSPQKIGLREGRERRRSVRPPPPPPRGK